LALAPLQVSLQLDFGSMGCDLLLCPLLEGLIIEEDPVLDAAELLDDREYVLRLELLSVEQLKDVFQLSARDVAVMVSINLFDGHHDLVQLVVLDEYLNKVFFTQGFKALDLLAIVLSLTQVPVDIHGLVQRFEVSHVHSLVHSIQDYVVLLVEDAGYVDDTALL